MFKFSKGTDYAILGLIYIASRHNKSYCDISEIADANGIPKAYLAKLFHVLANRGIVRSHRGKEGGFFLARRPGEISVLEVVEAIEGPISADCAMKKGSCRKDNFRCSLYDVFKECTDKTRETLGRYSIETLVRKQKN